MVGSTVKTDLEQKLTVSLALHDETLVILAAAKTDTIVVVVNDETFDHSVSLEITVTDVHLRLVDSSQPPQLPVLEGSVLDRPAVSKHHSKSTHILLSLSLGLALPL